MEIIFWCPSERKTVGSVECTPGTLVDAALLKRSLVTVGTHDELKSTRNHAPLICALCGTTLLVGKTGMTPAQLIADNFRPLVGTFAAGGE